MCDRPILASNSNPQIHICTLTVYCCLFFICAPHFIVLQFITQSYCGQLTMLWLFILEWIMVMFRVILRPNISDFIFLNMDICFLNKYDWEPQLRSWFSAGRGWRAHSGSRKSCFFTWWNLNISGFSSQMSGEWSGILRDWCHVCSHVDTVMVCCDEESWAWNQRHCPPSPVTMGSGYWPKEWDCQYKQRK